jgi:hypothetical protein
MSSRLAAFFDKIGISGDIFDMGLAETMGKKTRKNFCEKSADILK